jgi:dipicolinate synthase subunit A
VVEVQNMDFSVIGGDMRQSKLAELLASDGHTVKTFGLERDGTIGAKGESCLSDAVLGSQYIILPMPAFFSDGKLNTPLSESTIWATDILDALTPRLVLFAGRVGDDFKTEASSRGIRLFDYYEDEALTIKNADITAEGAVQILMESLPTSLRGAKCLVIGFGRIGKLLSRKLDGLDAKVTVSARKSSDFAWIDCLGLGKADTRTLSDSINRFDIIVNTVPARVLSREVLGNVRRDALILDLASSPGGVDFDAAAYLGLKVTRALSLPGKVAPQSSALAIKETIYNIINELECGNAQ